MDTVPCAGLRRVHMLSNLGGVWLRIALNRCLLRPVGLCALALSLLSAPIGAFAQDGSSWA